MIGVEELQMYKEKEISKCGSSSWKTLWGYFGL